MLFIAVGRAGHLFERDRICDTDLFISERWLHLQRAEVFLIVLFHCERGQELGVEVLGGEAKALAAVATDDLSNVARP